MEPPPPLKGDAPTHGTVRPLVPADSRGEQVNPHVFASTIARFPAPGFGTSAKPEVKALDRDLRRPASIASRTPGTICVGAIRATSARETIIEIHRETTIMRRRFALLDVATVCVLVLAIAIALMDGSPLRRTISERRLRYVQNTKIRSTWSLLANTATLLNSDNQRDPTVIVVSDYECPFCKTAESSIDSAVVAGVRISVLHLPIPSHVSAKAAALYALCSERLGEFASIHRRLFQDQSWRSNEGATYDKVELAMNRFTPLNGCEDHKLLDTDLEKHVRAANNVGVDATPTFLARDGVIRPRSGESLTAMLLRAGKDSQQSSK